VLITIEGVDGAGKSTLAAALAGRIGAVLLREPGGVELAERIRALVADPALDVDPRAEALLFAAARAQLVAARVRPLLAEGRVVLLDRFVDSSLAYQGAARGLGIDAVRAVNDFGTGGLVPDRTLLLRVPVAIGRERRAGVDRLEQEAEPFFVRVAEGYDALARAEPGRFRVLDATRPPAVVLEEAVAALAGVVA
jgi:dTMP kinase